MVGKDRNTVGWPLVQVGGFAAQLWHAGVEYVVPQLGAVNGSLLQIGVYAHTHKAHTVVLQHHDGKWLWHASSSAGQTDETVACVPMITTSKKYLAGQQNFMNQLRDSVNMVLWYDSCLLGGVDTSWYVIKALLSVKTGR